MSCSTRAGTTSTFFPRYDGDDLDEATENAREALVLHVAGFQDDGGSLPEAPIRRTLPIPA